MGSWDDAIKTIRMDFDCGQFYSIALSFLERKDDLSELPCVSFNNRTMNYEICLTPSHETTFDTAELTWIVKHELEHILRMHIPREAAVLPRSRAKKYYGHEVAHAVANVVEDIIIDADLRNFALHDEAGPPSLDWAPHMLGDWARFSDKEKKEIDLKQVSMEKLFFMLDRKLPTPEDGKTNKQRMKEVLDFILDGIKSGRIKLDVMPQGYEEMAGVGGSTVADGQSVDDNIKALLIDHASNQILESLKQAGSSAGKYFRDLVEAKKERYTIDSFLDRIVSFSTTDEIHFTRRRPARRPNCQVGIIRTALSPNVAILVDASGSVCDSTYLEFFSVARSVADNHGAKIAFIIFDGCVQHVSEDVPAEVKKTDGGTNFCPAILKAVELEFDRAIMLTDSFNFDTIPADLSRKIEVIYLLDQLRDQRVKSELPIPRYNFYYLDDSKKNVIPFGLENAVSEKKPKS